jgi:pimeloyl-ACP methyl ester carboxylesterase
MKNQLPKRLNLLLFVTVSFTIVDNAYSQIPPDYRAAVWVHGLRGNSNNWNKWSELFRNERKLYSQGSINYRTTNNGIETAVRRDIRVSDEKNFSSYFADPKDQARSIWFGHSMGGVVEREIDVSYPGFIGGVVTLGSPLDGARIANSVINGQAEAFLNDGQDKITRGSKRQGIQLVYSLVALFNRNANYYNDFGAKQQIAKLTKIIEDNAINQGAAELAEGSTYLSQAKLRQYTSTPKIHIYGNEDSPGLWRLASSWEQLENNKPASEDTYYVDDIRSKGDLFNALMWTNIGLAAATGWWTFGIGAAYYGWVANGWAEGRDWLRYDAENGWNSLIGANTPSYRTVTYSSFDYNRFYQCMYNGSGYGSYGYTYNRYSECSQQATSYVTYYYYSPVNGQSDAFIKAPSQTGYNSPWSSNAVSIEAKGVNHAEMLDNDKIKDILNRIFDGLEGDRSFFPTARR